MVYLYDTCKYKGEKQIQITEKETKAIKHTKNLLKCLFAAFCTTTLVFTASAFSPETVETAAEQTEARKETAALSAVVSTKPGLNILTGTTEPFGFEVETKDALSGLFADSLTNWDLTADPVDGSKGKTLRQAKAGLLLSAHRLQETRMRQSVLLNGRLTPWELINPALTLL